MKCTILFIIASIFLCGCSLSLNLLYNNGAEEAITDGSTLDLEPETMVT